jgi:16S rRNA (guanine527-N7)-methyltransferase
VQAPPYPIDFRRALADALPGEAAALSPEVIDLLELHARLLLHWNRRYGLTSITDPAEMVRRHIAEPLAALPYVGAGDRIVDLGSGGGVPGVPLHVARLSTGGTAGRETDATSAGRTALALVESSSKKALFLEAVVAGLHLKGVRVVERHARRAADLTDLTPVDVFTARAIPSPARVVEWLPELLAPGGRGLLFLGEEAATGAEQAALRKGLVIVRRQLLEGRRASFLLVLARPDRS